MLFGNLYAPMTELEESKNEMPSQTHFSGSQKL